MGDPGLFGGLQFVYVEDPMAELATCPSILIRQEPEFLEAMLGCEEPNIYHVFGNSPLGYRYLFKCFEQSECCGRMFCPSGKREFNMDIIHCNSFEQLGMEYNTPFANFHKPFMCAMGCFCRPEITISINSTKKVVGKATHIWTCCDPTFECYDGKGHLKYIVSANCCQCILLCPGMIGKSYEGQFDILDPASNKAIGNIIKEPATFSEMVTDADSYTVNFPPNANAYDKLLLMGLTILADYQYFETNSSNNNRRRGLGFGGLMGVGMGYDVGYGGYGGYGGYAVPIRVGVGKRKKRRK
jgi:hypothetical protein